MYKTRTIYVDEKDVTQVLLKMQDMRAWPLFVSNGSVGNCGWANAPTRWYVQVKSSKGHFNMLKTQLRAKGVAIIDPEMID